MARAYEEDPRAVEHIVALQAHMLEPLAETIATDAARYAPVDTAYLMSHIDAHKVTPTHWRVVANAAYAAAVEGGHLTPAGTHVPAQPYLRPAAYKNRSGDLR
jgi:hypothetical protein